MHQARSSDRVPKPRDGLSKARSPATVGKGTATIGASTPKPGRGMASRPQSAPQLHPTPGSRSRGGLLMDRPPDPLQGGLLEPPRPPSFSIRNSEFFHCPPVWGWNPNEQTRA